jgi:hypothetical protein
MPSFFPRVEASILRLLSKGLALATSEVASQRLIRGFTAYSFWALATGVIHHSVDALETHTQDVGDVTASESWRLVPISRRGRLETSMEWASGDIGTRRADSIAVLLSRASQNVQII